MLHSIQFFVNRSWKPLNYRLFVPIASPGQVWRSIWYEFGDRRLCLEDAQCSMRLRAGCRLRPPTPNPSTTDTARALPGREGSAQYPMPIVLYIYVCRCFLGPLNTEEAHQEAILFVGCKKAIAPGLFKDERIQYLRKNSISRGNTAGKKLHVAIV